MFEDFTLGKWIETKVEKTVKNDSCMFYNKFKDEGWLFYNKFEDEG